MPTTNYTRVRITEPYEAWQYPGGEIPEDVQKRFGLLDCKYRSLEESRAKTECDRMYARKWNAPEPNREPSESVSFVTAHGLPMLYPGNYIVNVDGFIMVYTADELEALDA